MVEHVNTIFFEINTRKLEIDRITQRFDTSFDPIKTNSHFILKRERERILNLPLENRTRFDSRPTPTVRWPVPGGEEEGKSSEENRISIWGKERGRWGSAVVCRRPLFFADRFDGRGFPRVLPLSRAATIDVLTAFSIAPPPSSVESKRKQWPAGITGYTYELGVDERVFDFLKISSNRGSSRS